MTDVTAAPAPILLTSIVGTWTSGQDVTASPAPLTLAAPAPRVGLTASPAPLQLTARAGSVGVSAPGKVTVDVYAPDGVTHRAFLPNAVGVHWQWTAAQAGTAAVLVPLDDPNIGQITDLSILRISQYGAPQFACIVDKEKTALAVDGAQNRYLDLASTPQPGVFALLDEALVYPWFGIRRQSSQTRWFGAMSPRPSSRVVDWWSDQAHLWGALRYSPQTDGLHKNFPPELTNTPDAQWAACPPGPDVTVPDGVEQYYRVEFDTTATDIMPLRIVVAVDNYGTVWLDGEEVITPAYQALFGWKNATTVTVNVPPGAGHVLAVKAENGQRFTYSFGAAHNPVAFIASVDQLDTNGNVYKPLFRTKPDNAWLGAPGPVGWHPAQVILQLLREAKARSGRGALLITADFDEYRDSNGDPWTTTRGEFQIQINTPLGQVVTAMADYGLDIDMTPDLHLRVYNAGSAGTNRTGSVIFTAGNDDANLSQADTTRQYQRATVALAQQAGGAWSETTDSVGVAAVGRIEAAAAYGTTGSDFTSNTLANKQLAESAHPIITGTFRTDDPSAPQAGRDYFRFDRVTTPGHRGSGTLVQRVLQITGDAATNEYAVTHADGVVSPP